MKEISFRNSYSPFDHEEYFVALVQNSSLSFDSGFTAWSIITIQNLGIISDLPSLLYKHTQKN